jgi:hypothetical protein
MPLKTVLTWDDVLVKLEQLERRLELLEEKKVPSPPGQNTRMVRVSGVPYEVPVADLGCGIVQDCGSRPE